MKIRASYCSLAIALMSSSVNVSDAAAEFPCQWYKVTTNADGKPEYIVRGKTVESDTPQPAADLKCFGVCPAATGTGTEPCPTPAQKCIQISFKSRGATQYEHDCSCKTPAPSGPPTLATSDDDNTAEICSDPRNNPVPLYFNVER